jgi:hypothetical protein
MHPIPRPNPKVPELLLCKTMLMKRDAKVPLEITMQDLWASASALAFSHTHLDSISSPCQGWTHRHSHDDRDYACAGPSRPVSDRPLAAPGCCPVRCQSRWTSHQIRRKRSRRSRGVCGIYSRLGRRWLVTLCLSFHFNYKTYRFFGESVDIVRTF